MNKVTTMLVVVLAMATSPGLSFTHLPQSSSSFLSLRRTLEHRGRVMRPLKSSKKNDKSHESSLLVDTPFTSFCHYNADNIHTNNSHRHDGLFTKFQTTKKNKLGTIIPSLIMGMIIFCTTVTMMPGEAMASNISENPPPFFNVQQTASSEASRNNNHSNDQNDENKAPSRRPSAMTNSKYWDMVKSNDLSEVQFANERLMDHAIGTINTMYYDNTGGAKFNTKDMYDRWRVMKTYARDGIDGVRDMTRGSLGKDVTKSRLAAAKGGSESTSSNEDANPVTNTARDTMFIPQLFLIEGDTVQVQKQHRYSDREIETQKVPANAFNSRDDAVTSLKWLVSTLDDPYSKYLTRDELMRELKVRDDGFLGLGAVVEAPPKSSSAKSIVAKNSDTKRTTADSSPSSQSPVVSNSPSSSSSSSSSYVTSIRVSNLPMVTAIVPDSPAERAGIVVGDRIAAVGVDNFVGLGRDEILKKMTVYTGAENYFGQPDLTIAKPVKRSVSVPVSAGIQDPTTVRMENDDSVLPDREELIGYKLSRVRLPTTALEPFKPRSTQVSFPDVIPAASAADTNVDSQTMISGGDSIVHWELLTNKDSIFRKMTSRLGGEDDSSVGNLSGSGSGSGVDRVGYIRLTRFSRASTAGYIKAVEELERAGAQSYIIDVRNNYGGIIQESMLTASSLLRDPHTVLCYTLNSRGGFTPHDVEEYVVDKRYPGYLLSSEPSNVSYEQVRREDPDFLTGNNWVPPSAYASLHEQKMKRNYNRPTGITAMMNPFQKRYNENLASEEVRQLRAQKKIAVLMNEGTASAAEVFVSSLRDNGRTVALVGTKTYGKGLIQHTFPMIDGGGLRMTVAEYLTPSLQHVTKVGGAQYDRKTGEFVGGGVRPDVYCPSTQGIPSNVGADICVGVALDALEDANDRDLQAMASDDDLDKSNTGKGSIGRRRTVRPGEFERMTKPLYQ